MILFLNVFVTTQRWAHYEASCYPHYDRLDIFKYSLASLSVINWSKVIIYCQLDTEFTTRQNELENYIQQLFPNAEFYPYRNDRQKKWQKALEPLCNIPDDLVWFACNDDHIFIDYDLTCLNEMVGVLKNRDRKFISCYYSHFPEMVRNSVNAPSVQLYDNYFSFEHPDVDSVQIIPKDVLFSWWFDYNYGDAFMPRTDTYGGTWVNSEVLKVCIPFRELCRHFEGYSHVSVNFNHCPALFIPEGFFTNDIKISYCSDVRKNGFTWINPFISTHFAYDGKGADIRVMLEDLPLFWRNRISAIEVTEKDPQLLLQERNKVIWELINADERSYPCVPNPECARIFMR